MTFDQLGLSAPILDAIEEQGYSTPSPIQESAIPTALEGHDIMAAAQTGTGKTAGFTLPLLELLSKGKPTKTNQVRALILTPTRELAAQVGESVSTYSKHLSVSSTVVYGGVKINPQIQKLRQGADILVATPGRLLDLFGQKAVRFDNLEVLVLDEADRMLDMGFIHDIRKILNILPKKRQNLLFSATFSDQIRTLAKSIVHEPVEISVTPANSTVKVIDHWICPVDKGRKSKLLISLFKQEKWQQVLVFTRTKHGANRLTRQLESEGIKAAAIHGNKSQGARNRALSEFKDGSIRALVATDIAARGIDIDQLPHVVNFDLPNVAEDYVHRIGRTGRAGASGEAISLVSADEFDQLISIERLTGKLLERKVVDGFEPSEELPESNLNSRSRGKKKPAQTKKPRSRRPEHKDGQRSADNARGHKPTGKNKRHQKPSSSKDQSNSGRKPTTSTTGDKPAPRRPRRRPASSK